MVVLAIVGFIALCLLAAGVYDWRIRRRRADLGGAGGIDHRAARDTRRINETDVRMRSNQRDFGNPSGGMGGF